MNTRIPFAVLIERERRYILLLQADARLGAMRREIEELSREVEALDEAWKEGLSDEHRATVLLRVAPLLDGGLIDTIDAAAEAGPEDGIAAPRREIAEKEAPTPPRPPTAPARGASPEGASPPEGRSLESVGGVGRPDTAVTALGERGAALASRGEEDAAGGKAPGKARRAPPPEPRKATSTGSGAEGAGAATSAPPGGTTGLPAEGEDVPDPFAGPGTIATTPGAPVISDEAAIEKSGRDEGDEPTDPFAPAPAGDGARDIEVAAKPVAHGSGNVDKMPPYEAVEDDEGPAEVEPGQVLGPVAHTADGVPIFEWVRPPSAVPKVEDKLPLPPGFDPRTITYDDFKPAVEYPGKTPRAIVENHFMQGVKIGWDEKQRGKKPSEGKGRGPRKKGENFGHNWIVPTSGTAPRAQATATDVAEAEEARPEGPKGNGFAPVPVPAGSTPEAAEADWKRGFGTGMEDALSGQPDRSVGFSGSERRGYDAGFAESRDGDVASGYAADAMSGRAREVVEMPFDRGDTSRFSRPLSMGEAEAADAGASDGEDYDEVGDTSMGDGEDEYHDGGGYQHEE